MSVANKAKKEFLGFHGSPTHRGVLGQFWAMPPHLTGAPPLRCTAQVVSKRNRPMKAMFHLPLSCKHLSCEDFYPVAAMTHSCSIPDGHENWKNRVEKSPWVPSCSQVWLCRRGLRSHSWVGTPIVAAERNNNFSCLHTYANSLHWPPPHLVWTCTADKTGCECHRAFVIPACFLTLNTHQGLIRVQMLQAPHHHWISQNWRPIQIVKSAMPEEMPITQ